MSKRGYVDIQPPIYEKLDWDLDLIVKFLEYYRNEVPKVLETLGYNECAEYDLVALQSPHGDPFPVIGVHLTDPKLVADFFDMEELVTNDLDHLSKTELIRLCSNIKAPKWKELLKLRRYPNRD